VNLGRVTGTVTCTRRVAELAVHRLAIVQPVDETGADAGRPIVAADHLIRASAGARVWYVNGADAADAFDAPQPVDAVVVGMVDPA
jgi:microcompartment protein CcmK/EutM